MTQEWFLPRGEAVLHVVESGEGPPLFFQHGLSADAGQIALNLPEGLRLRRLTMECRAHGKSTVGETDRFSIAGFAEDLLAVADKAGIDRFFLGGISMGAAISLRIATLHPERVRGLALVRPAWLYGAAPSNMRPFVEIAALLKAHEPAEAARRFEESETARRIAIDSPDNLASLRGLFTRPNVARLARLIGDIGSDGPGVSPPRPETWTIPTICIGCAEDFVHPLAYARSLAEATGGQFVEVAAKTRTPERHFAEMSAALGRFFETLADTQETSR